MEIENHKSCVSDPTPISEWGMLSLLHLAEYGDKAAIAEIQRRKEMAGK